MIGQWDWCEMVKSRMNHMETNENRRMRRRQLLSLVTLLPYRVLMGAKTAMCQWPIMNSTDYNDLEIDKLL